MVSLGSYFVYWGASLLMHIESIKLTEIYKPIASILRLHYVVNSATGALPETIGACSVMSYLWFCCKQCIKEIIIICYGLGKHYGVHWCTDWVHMNPHAPSWRHHWSFHYA